MKKRLLITSALMTAVLGASLATGTYAWYQASGTATTNTVKSTDVSVSKPTIEVGGIYELEVSVEEVTEKSALQLTEYVAAVEADEASGVTASAAKYTHYYINNKGQKVSYAGETGKVNSKVYKISLKTKDGTYTPDEGNAVNYTAAQAASALAGQNVTISVANAETGSDSRTKLYITDSVIADDVVFDGAATPTNSVTTSEFTEDDWLNGTGVVAYVAVRVDGNYETNNNETGNYDDGDIEVKFNVTVASVKA